MDGRHVHSRQIVPLRPADLVGDCLDGGLVSS